MTRFDHDALSAAHTQRELEADTVAIDAREGAGGRQSFADHLMGMPAQPQGEGDGISRVALPNAYYECAACTENGSEGNCRPADEIRFAPDETWLCEYCYDDAAYECGEDANWPVWAELPKLSAALTAQPVAQFLATEDGEFNGNAHEPVSGGRILSFEPGFLRVNVDGSGYFCVPDAEMVFEDDRQEGPDGPEGSIHWIARMDASEIVALRDFLNGALIATPAQPVAWSSCDSRLANKIEDLIAEFGSDPITALACVSEWLQLRRHEKAHPATPAPVEAGLRWNKTADGLPKKPGKRDYEQIECLIMLPNGDLEISVWNCEHEVWDDAEGDDYRYDPEHPTHWMALAPFRAALRAQSAPVGGEVKG